ncbi:hypothetical protein K437DRAFT_296498 [Tilletiaria anomala UBC 951]|uniref:Mini-chromosome maintenance complex-binding protein n=1 Tax=Tilletiaria anomala (strain ATCC 24038 / CBS 436.72 / UBC 951) TaxID=1037660 RepID=A0A066V8D6_TILAU|nr:uncharacterized protein K437DRAFT_296498 [Tilletiaria anomala UBC 951]KDN37741.1 hypothetical protein K437DRAFT_296498 [Tilletiaria anomala UBC 951]
MVVPADTDFSRALIKPLELIQSLLDQIASNGGPANLDTLPATAAKKFEEIFTGSRESFAKIPTLAAVLSRDGAAGSSPAQQPKLVRWRCMIQDTGLGTEMFLKTLPSTTASSPADSKLSGYFGAGDFSASATDSSASGGTPAPALLPDEYSNLAERTSMYAVSVPGETDWHAEAWNDAPSGTMLETSTSMKMKQPLAGENGTIGALLKIYDASISETMGVTDVVEVVGVLSSSPFPTSEWQSSGAASSASVSNTESLLPCLHVIYSHSITFDTLPPSLRVDVSATPELILAEQQEKEREALVAYLQAACQGDELVAEFLLLALTARVRSTRAGVAVGSLSLNICDASAAPELMNSLASVLGLLCPSVVSQSLALCELNDTSKQLFPSSDGENLKAGRLQLPKGSVLLIDESKMGEGELKDTGVRNVRALNSVIANRKLPYAFPYSEFEFDSDLNVIVVSQGKSFLSLDVYVPIQATAHIDVQVAEPSAASLHAWRRLILESRRSELTVSQEMADLIQKEFVAARKGAMGAKALGQEDLLRRMAIARLYALSHGKADLNMGMWRKVVGLDEECSRRLMALPSRKST